MKKIICIISLIIVFIMLALFFLSATPLNKKNFLRKEQFARATYYRPIQKETDSTPTITASLTNTTKDSPDTIYLAVSQDMYPILNYKKADVFVRHSNLLLPCKVDDKMNAKYNGDGRIDFRKGKGCFYYPSKYEHIVYYVKK